jgi:chemotaxis regulatin CheY-phosphate phosphatase CheZ
MTQKLTTTEAENLAYLAGDTKTADLYARIDALQRALGQAVATLQAIDEDLKTVKHARGAAREALAIIGQNFDLFDIEGTPA